MGHVCRDRHHRSPVTFIETYHDNSSSKGLRMARQVPAAARSSLQTYFTKQRQHAPCSSVGGELPRPCESASPQRSPQMAYRENLHHRFSHRRYVLWVDKNRRLIHYFRNRRPVPCDHRSTACHGLQCRQSEALLKGWKHKQRAAAIHSREMQILDKSRKQNTITDTEITYQAFERLPMLPITASQNKLMSVPE